MSVSSELLCSFELLKPLDSSALKSHIKKGRNKRNTMINSPVSQVLTAPRWPRDSADSWFCSPRAFILRVYSMSSFRGKQSGTIAICSMPRHTADRASPEQQSDGCRPSLGPALTIHAHQPQDKLYSPRFGDTRVRLPALDPSSLPSSPPPNSITTALPRSGGVGTAASSRSRVRNGRYGRGRNNLRLEQGWEDLEWSTSLREVPDPPRIRRRRFAKGNSDREGGLGGYAGSKQGWSCPATTQPRSAASSLREATTHLGPRAETEQGALGRCCGTCTSTLGFSICSFIFDTRIRHYYYTQASPCRPARRPTSVKRAKRMGTSGPLHTQTQTATGAL